MWINKTGRPAAGRAREVSARLGTAALAPLVAAAVVGLDPARVGLSTTPGVLHALSFRGSMAVGLCTLGVSGLSSTRLGDPVGARRWRRATAAAALLAAGMGQLAVVNRRGWKTPATPGRADLVVVSLNTLGGRATPGQIAALVVSELAMADAAMLALPETPSALAREAARLLATAGHRFQVFSAAGGPRPLATTSLLISEELGSYRQLTAPSMLLGAVLAEPIQGSGPTMAAVHPGAPMPAVGYPQWRSDVTRAVALCRDTPNSIVAGDFNACLDHQMMRDLGPAFDAAAVAGRAAEGTWPAHFPAPLAAPIDHVLLHGDFAVLGTRTLRVGQSDHRAVIARLTRS